MTDYRKMSREELEKMMRYGDSETRKEIRLFIDYYGRQVEVFKGRKVPKGITGKIFWLDSYHMTSYNDRVIKTINKAGIRTENGDVYFTSVDNLKILD